MSVEFRSQRIARQAFQCVEERQKKPNRDKYLSFARAFPTLIHTSGLAQAGAFALAKGSEKLDVLDDLAEVINAADNGWGLKGNAAGKALDNLARNKPTDEYVRLTRDALQAATWIKRYAEALLASKSPGEPSQNADDEDTTRQEEPGHDHSAS